MTFESDEEDDDIEDETDRIYHEPFQAKTTITDYILQSEEAAKFFTGLEACHRHTLWELCERWRDNLEIFGTKCFSRELRSMSVSCQFLLTLYILRHNRKYTDLAYQFKIQKRLISNVFK